MAKWRVYNRHPNGLTHKERFREDMIEIKANEFVLMDYEDAVQFRGQFCPVVKDAQGVHDPKSFKCIYLEPDKPMNGAAKDAAKILVCNLDGEKFVNEAALNEHLKTHASLVHVDDSLEQELKENIKIEQDLMKNIPPLPRKKRGRPFAKNRGANV